MGQCVLKCHACARGSGGIYKFLTQCRSCHDDQIVGGGGRAGWRGCEFACSTGVSASCNFVRHLQDHIKTARIAGLSCRGEAAACEAHLGVAKGARECGSSAADVGLRQTSSSQSGDDSSKCARATVTEVVGKCNLSKGCVWIRVGDRITQCDGATAGGRMIDEFFSENRSRVDVDKQCVVGWCASGRCASEVACDRAGLACVAAGRR